MIQHKIVDGKIVALTPQEITDRQNAEAAWLASQPSPLEVAMKDLRVRRNKALADSDWTQLPDVGFNAAERNAWMIYRQALRDITNNIETAEQAKSISFPVKP
jgi:hypothetical protein